MRVRGYGIAQVSDVTSVNILNIDIKGRSIFTASTMALRENASKSTIYVGMKRVLLNLAFFPLKCKSLTYSLSNSFDLASTPPSPYRWPG